MNRHYNRTIDLSHTAPHPPSPMVYRPHLINTIVRIFDSNTEFVCIEGGPGYGKTTLLKEFADSADDPCFGVFLRGASRLSYDSVLTRYELANQVTWYLTSQTLSDDCEPTDGELRTLFQKCARKLNRKRQSGYIIVDGIYHIPSEEESIREAILDLLPFEVKPFKFLFSSNNDTSKYFNRRRLSPKPFPISSFTSHETDEFLKDLVNQKTDRSKFHTALSGIPILLASFRRLYAQSVQSGNEFTLKTAVTDHKLLFEEEWRLFGPYSENVTKALGYILASGYPVDSKTISTNCSIDEKEIENAFARLPFLTVSKKSNNWEFSSELFRKFAETKLRDSVRSANEIIVSNLLENPDSSVSLSQLPLYLERIDNSEKLLGWLNETRLASILRKTRTAATIEPTLRKAIGISHESTNDRALITYSIQHSIIKQLSQTTGLEHEIRARSALGDYEGALEVANNAPLHTQRLRLLAVLVESFHDRPGFQIRPQLNEINELLRQIDISELPKEEAFDIAIDLYRVDAKLALRLFKEILQGDIEDSSFEIELARITLAAIHLKAISESHEGEDKHYSIPKELEVDLKLRSLLEASSISNHAKSASEVLEATKSMDDPNVRLYFQRKWITRHPFQDDALDVVESAINEAITVTQFTPNATFYREISTPLANSNNREHCRKLVEIFDGQQSIIRRKGPTIDFVRLQLHLAECDFVNDNQGRTVTRLEDLLFNSVESIEELETRMTCLAWFSAELHKYNPSAKSDEIAAVLELVDEELEKTLKEILENCAEQFKILSKTLDAFALYRPKTALTISRTLNTIERRNEAFLHIVVAMCRAITNSPDSNLLFEIFDEIELCSYKNSAIKEITKRLCQEIQDGKEPITIMERLFGRLNQCPSSSIKMKCLGKLAITIEKNTEFEELRNSIARELLAEFNSIENTHLKYKLACQLIATLRAKCPELANEIFRYLTAPDLGNLRSENMNKGVFYLIDLITKATWALAKSSLLTDDDIQIVCVLIEKIRDPFMRVNLFSTLAFYLWRENHTEFFSKIVDQHIWSTLNKIKGSDRTLIYSAWRNAYPSVWLNDRDRARSAIKNFPAEIREDCTSTLCYSLLRKQPPGEPFDDESHRTDPMLSYSDIQNLLQLCNETDEDFMIFFIFEWIASVVSERNPKIHLTREQKAEISRRMLEISKTKLPAKNRIQHTGFQILCKSQVLRFGKPDNSEWQKLIKESKSLASDADRVYVLAHIASYLPNKLKNQRKLLFDIAESEAENLKTIEDQYERLFAIANLTAKNKSEKAPQILKKAFKTITQSSSRHNASRENQIVDLACKLDPELPMELAVIYDDDPARDEYRLRAKKQLDAHKLRKDIGDLQHNVNLRSLPKDTNLTSAAWQAIGSLNSRRMIPTTMLRSRDMLTCASTYPLMSSYSMYSWVLTNVMLKYSKTPEAQKYIRDLFEGLLKGVEFFFLVTEDKQRLGSNPQWQDLGDDENHIIIQNGEREKALQYIQDWLHQYAEDNITIVDPYFSPDDLELVLQILETDSCLKVQIVTGKGYKPNSTDSLSSLYSKEWRHLCDHSPPETEILVVRTVKTGRIPFHDRWILTKSMGLQLGTSFNSLGNRDSRISKLGSNEVMSLRHTVNRYHAKEIREFDGERVTYESFELLS